MGCTARGSDEFSILENSKWYSEVKIWLSRLDHHLKLWWYGSPPRWKIKPPLPVRLLIFIHTKHFFIFIFLCFIGDLSSLKTPVTSAADLKSLDVQPPVSPICKNAGRVVFSVSAYLQPDTELYVTGDPWNWSTCKQDIVLSNIQFLPNIFTTF